jgi:DNA-binding NarL/FixJ family response regulator
MRWTRTNKAELATRIAELVAQGLKPRQIAERLGKSRRRIEQIAKLFSLQGRTIVR